jgi:hypothetical protein
MAGAILAPARPVFWISHSQIFKPMEPIMSYTQSLLVVLFTIRLPCGLQAHCFEKLVSYNTDHPNSRDRILYTHCYTIYTALFRGYNSSLLESPRLYHQSTQEAQCTQAWVNTNYKVSDHYYIQRWHYIICSKSNILSLHIHSLTSAPQTPILLPQHPPNTPINLPLPRSHIDR